MREQLQALAKRITAKYIQQKPGGFAADYVSHGDIQQMLLAILGPCPQRVTQVIRNAEGTVQGCVLQMTFTIDGEEIVIEEVGECERPGPNEGLNLKNAVSDAIKRCAMRVGLGLQLWTQEHYGLDKALEARAKKEEGGESDE